MVCHSLLQWTTFCQTSPPWLSCLGWPHTAWLSFIELDHAVVRVIRLASFLWVWFQCVCPLMPSCNTHRLTWVFLYLGRGVSLHGCSSKAQLLLLTLDEGYLLRAAPPDLERGVVPLSPPAPMQPLLLGHGVASLGRLPWLRVCGSSSWPLPSYFHLVFLINLQEKWCCCFYFTDGETKS